MPCLLGGERNRQFRSLDPYEKKHVHLGAGVGGVHFGIPFIPSLARSSIIASATFLLIVAMRCEDRSRLAYLLDLMNHHRHTCIIFSSPKRSI